MRTFYLGVPEPYWLGRLRIPLFVSHRRMARTRGWPQALVPWGLDSGGFTEVTTYGEWRTGPVEYVHAVRRYVREVGKMDFASQQDWMCEPFALAKTGKSLREHQELTVQNYLELKNLDPALPFMPVLQGWKLDDYLRCIDMFYKAGIKLEECERVGVGSVCRRQKTKEIIEIVRGIQGTRQTFKLHMFGVKKMGLRMVHDLIKSSDSMAWSLEAFRAKRKARPTCTHKNCSSCIYAAIDSYINMVWEDIPRPHQAQLILLADMKEYAKVSTCLSTT